MGEKTEYEKGDKAPNPGTYTEVGEARSFHTEIQHPQRITMEKGDTFPETTNKNRKWKKAEKARVH
ncbi:YjzC family protein [Paenibacillus donghaensis]|uniref:YjzC family protein n=1 Tax=Paenibacillus donghaensis TaxID=414771 RepID=A0A2Z2KV06_9BACL|nr:YjzC family protein [Paenibacillus donghaensis]ASA24981.1 YjzC family protein [Paenibacillus donghaensis]